MLNHEGVKYGDLDNVALSNMTGGINKALAKNGITAEQKAEYERKREAVVLILKTRNGGNDVPHFDCSRQFGARS